MQICARQKIVIIIETRSVSFSSSFSYLQKPFKRTVATGTLPPKLENEEKPLCNAEAADVRTHWRAPDHRTRMKPLRQAQKANSITQAIQREAFTHFEVLLGEETNKSHPLSQPNSKHRIPGRVF